MKQFFTILKFEFNNFIKNKTFIITTVFLCILVAGALSFPRISAMIKGDDIKESEPTGEKSIIAVIDETNSSKEQLQTILSAGFPNNQIKITDENEANVKQKVMNKEYESAVILKSSLSYQYIVENLSMYDDTTMVLDQLLRQNYQMNEMTRLGLTVEQAASLLNAPVEQETLTLGTDQGQNFFFTYILIFVLYMAILLYGSNVATSVATEKSSRAMEILITSAKPINLIFGKVFGTGLAGITQLALLLGTGVLFSNLNAEYLAGNPIMRMISSMSIEILIYAVVFFILGFFIYAFLYAATASLVSRMEELNTAIQPITYIFIIAFMITMFSMSSGNVDNMAIKIASFVPLTSPMAMFTRITMSQVPFIEIIISIVILAVSCFLVAFLAAKIYKLGVLLYGTRPKMKEVFKMLKEQ